MGFEHVNVASPQGIGANPQLENNTPVKEILAIDAAKGATVGADASAKDKLLADFITKPPQSAPAGRIVVAENAARTPERAATPADKTIGLPTGRHSARPRVPALDGATHPVEKIPTEAATVAAPPRETKLTGEAKLMHERVRAVLTDMTNHHYKAADGQKLLTIFDTHGPIQAIMALKRDHLEVFREKFTAANGGKPFDDKTLDTLPSVTPYIGTFGNRAAHPIKALGRSKEDVIKEEGNKSREMLKLLIKPNPTEEEWLKVAMYGRVDLVNEALTKTGGKASDALAANMVRSLMEAAEEKAMHGWLWRSPDYEKIGLILGGLSDQSLKKVEETGIQLLGKHPKEAIEEKLREATLDNWLYGDRKHEVERYFTGNLGVDQTSTIKNAMNTITASDLFSRNLSWWGSVDRDRAALSILYTVASADDPQLATIDRRLSPNPNTPDYGKGFEEIKKLEKLPDFAKEALDVLTKKGVDPNGRRSDQDVQDLIEIAKKHQQPGLLQLSLNLASKEQRQSLQPQADALAAISSDSVEQGLIRGMLKNGKADLETLISANISKVGKIGFADWSDIKRLVASHGQEWRAEYLKNGDFTKRLDALFDRASSGAWATARKAEMRGQEELTSGLMNELERGMLGTLPRNNDLPVLVGKHFGLKEYEYLSAKNDPDGQRFKKLRDDLSTGYAPEQVEYIMASIDDKRKAATFEQSLEKGTPSLDEYVKRGKEPQDLMLALLNSSTNDQEKYRDDPAFRKLVDDQIDLKVKETEERFRQSSSPQASQQMAALNAYVKEMKSGMLLNSDTYPSSYAMLTMYAFNKHKLPVGPQTVVDDIEAAFKENPDLLRIMKAPKGKAEEEQMRMVATALAAAYESAKVRTFSAQANAPRVLMQDEYAEVLKTGRMPVWQRMELAADPVTRLQTFAEYKNQDETDLAIKVASDPDAAYANSKILKLFDDPKAYGYVAKQGSATPADLIHVAGTFNELGFFSKLVTPIPETKQLLDMIKDMPRDMVKVASMEQFIKYNELMYPTLSSVSKSEDKQTAWATLAETDPTDMQRVLRARESRDSRNAPTVYNWFIDWVSSSKHGVDIESNSMMANLIKEQTKAIEQNGTAEQLQEYQNRLKKNVDQWMDNYNKAEQSYGDNVRAVQLPISLASDAFWSVAAYATGVGVGAAPLWAKLPLGLVGKFGVLKMQIVQELAMRKMALGEGFGPADSISALVVYPFVPMKMFYVGIGAGVYKRAASKAAARLGTEEASREAAAVAMRRTSVIDGLTKK